ncbi:hypothetical protein Tco_0218673 [Tanacetum coccineum]
MINKNNEGLGFEFLWNFGRQCLTHVEDQVWKNQSDYKVLECKLYDSCGVHSLRKQNVHIHMLVEKRYPLTAPTITVMLNKKLKADHWNEMLLCSLYAVYVSMLELKFSVLLEKIEENILITTAEKIKTARRFSTIRERIETAQRKDKD